MLSAIRMRTEGNVVFQANCFREIQGKIKASRPDAGLTQRPGQAAHRNGRIDKRRKRHRHKHDVAAAGNCR